jgi:hypothetical protein
LRGQDLVDFDGDDAAGPGNEAAGQGAGAGADFKNHLLRHIAQRVYDLLRSGLVPQKMLAKFRLALLRVRRSHSRVFWHVDPLSNRRLHSKVTPGPHRRGRVSNGNYDNVPRCRWAIMEEVN